MTGDEEGEGKHHGRGSPCWEFCWECQDGEAKGKGDKCHGLKCIQWALPSSSTLCELPKYLSNACCVQGTTVMGAFREGMRRRVG
jgi:hypothetical protein